MMADVVYVAIDRSLLLAVAGCSSSSASDCREDVMPLLYVVGGVVSLGLLVYLVLALLKPELFQ